MNKASVFLAIVVILIVGPTIALQAVPVQPAKLEPIPLTIDCIPWEDLLTPLGPELPNIQLSDEEAAGIPADAYVKINVYMHFMAQKALYWEQEYNRMANIAYRFKC